MQDLHVTRYVHEDNRQQTENYRQRTASVDAASRAFQTHYKPPGPESVRVLTPFGLAGGKVAEVGQIVEVPGDIVADLVFAGRAEAV